MAARDRGGKFGIAVRDDGTILESCVLNVLVLGADNVLRTPPFAHILRGCTARKSLELAAQLEADGEIRGVVQEPVRLDDVYGAREVALVAGDTHVYPIVSLDARPIGSGAVGPVTRKLIAMLERDAADGDGDHQDVPSPR